MKATCTHALSFLIVLPVFFACLSVLAFAASSFATFDDVDEVLRFLEGKLTNELKSSDLSLRRKIWPDWIIKHDREIRGRLLPGDEDTIINWLLFGASFTKERKALFEVPETSRDLQKVISKRTTDLIGAL